MIADTTPLDQDGRGGHREQHIVDIPEATKDMLAINALFKCLENLQCLQKISGGGHLIAVTVGQSTFLAILLRVCLPHRIVNDRSNTRCVIQATRKAFDVVQRELRPSIKKAAWA